MTSEPTQKYYILLFVQFHRRLPADKTLHRCSQTHLPTQVAPVDRSITRKRALSLFLMRLHPGFSSAHFYQDRHRGGHGFFHGLFHQGRHHLHFVPVQIKDQFVVYLQ